MASDCIFCGVVAGRIPSQQVAEGDGWLAFQDIDPKAPTHILIVPREHIASLAQLQDAHAAVMGEIVLAGARIARAAGLEADGYRLVANAGRNAGQSVDHIHFHLLGGRRLGWPPG
jgi:histidine triad (HIT) family protein